MIGKIISGLLFCLLLLIGQSSGSIRIKAVYFDGGDTTLRAESKSLLDSLIFHYPEILSQCPFLIIKLSCHTDSHESEKADTLLSYKRGLAVKNYLVHHGIDGSKIIIKSYGGTQPLCPEETNGNINPECLQLNRRVEITIDRCKS